MNKWKLYVRRSVVRSEDLRQRLLDLKQRKSVFFHWKSIVEESNILPEPHPKQGPPEPHPKQGPPDTPRTSFRRTQRCADLLRKLKALLLELRNARLCKVAKALLDSVREKTAQFAASRQLVPTVTQLTRGVRRTSVYMGFLCFEFVDSSEGLHFQSVQSHFMLLM